MKKKRLIFALLTTLPLSLVAEETTVLSSSDAVPALTQLMNSRMFKGLSICTTDPWKGLEYAKNLELEYLQWALNSDQAREQNTFQKDISQFVIKVGRELQEVREKCLSVSKDPEVDNSSSLPKASGFPERDKDADGIP